jgi:hypothetical protein
VLPKACRGVERKQLLEFARELHPKTMQRTVR